MSNNCNPKRDFAIQQKIENEITKILDQCISYDKLNVEVYIHASTNYKDNKYSVLHNSDLDNKEFNLNFSFGVEETPVDDEDEENEKLVNNSLMNLNCNQKFRKYRGQPIESEEFVERLFINNY